MTFLKKQSKMAEQCNLAENMYCFGLWSLGVLASALLLLWSSSTWAGPKHYDIRLFIHQAHPFDRFSGSGSHTEKLTPLREWGFLSDTRPESVRPSKAIKAGKFSRGMPSDRSPKKLRKRINAYRAVVQPSSTVGAGAPRFQFGIGYFDVTDDWDAVEFRAEWHGREVYKKLRPLGGLMATSNWAHYGYAGLVADFDLGNRFAFSPSFAPGIYVRGGSAKKLGHWIEFRSMAELSYKLDGGARYGLAIYHLSNASLDDFNPGTEVISLSYTLPLN